MAEHGAPAGARPIEGDQEAADCELLLEQIRAEADSMGVDIFGVASAQEYAERFPEHPSPDLYVPDARSIIVMAEIIEPATMRTVLHPELSRSPRLHQQDASVGALENNNPQKYFTVEETEVIKQDLTRIGRHFVRKLRRLGYLSFNVPLCKRDSVSHLAPFVHAPAIWLAGLGTIGLNGLMLNSEFGPRYYVHVVITECPLPHGRPLETPLCVECNLCLRACPTGALRLDGSRDMGVCREYDACGTCMAVCPVGEVRPFAPAEVVRWLKSDRDVWTMADSKRARKS